MSDVLAGIAPHLQPLYQAELDKGKIGQDEHGTWRWYWTTPEGDRVLTSGVVVSPGTGKLVRYKRVTSFNKVVHDRANLEAWTLREIVDELPRHPDLVAAVLTANGDKKKLNKIVKQIRDRRGMDRAATLGSAIHAATEAVQSGQPVPNLGDYQADVDAYLKAVEPFLVIDREQFGISDTYGICGSWDGTFQIKRSGRLPFRFDIKTGSVNLGYLDEIAQQLASYTVMVPYDQSTGERAEPIELDVTRGLVVKVWPGQAQVDLIWVPLEKAMRTLLPLSQRIFEARNSQTKGYAFELANEINVPAVDDSDPIEAAIAAVTGDPDEAKAQLKAIWAEHREAWAIKAEHYKRLGDQRMADLARDVIVRAGLAA